MLVKIEVFNLLKKEENLNSLQSSSKRTAYGKICFNHALEMSIKKKLVGCVYKLKSTSRSISRTSSVSVGNVQK